MLADGEGKELTLVVEPAVPLQRECRRSYIMGQDACTRSEHAIREGVQIPAGSIRFRSQSRGLCGDHDLSQVSSTLQAQPRPLWHVLSAAMHVLPHARPPVHTLQH